MKLLDTNVKNYKKEFIFDLGREVKGDSHVTVSFYANDGGINYFTYRTEIKGYYVSVTPQTIENRGGYSTIRTTCFSGCKMPLKEIKRKSAKSFESCIDELSYGNFHYLCLQVDEEMTAEETKFMYDSVKENW